MIVNIILFNENLKFTLESDGNKYNNKYIWINWKVFISIIFILQEDGKEKQLPLVPHRFFIAEKIYAVFITLKVYL